MQSPLNIFFQYKEVTNVLSDLVMDISKNIFYHQTLPHKSIEYYDDVNLFFTRSLC